MEALFPYQVELEDPDYKRFPRLRDLHGFETLVGPGDLIYIPNCWWHQVETLTENSVSVTFWYKVGSVAASEDAMVFSWVSINIMFVARTAFCLKMIHYHFIGLFDEPKLIS